MTSSPSVHHCAGGAAPTQCPLDGIHRLAIALLLDGFQLQYAEQLQFTCFKMDLKLVHPPTPRPVYLLAEEGLDCLPLATKRATFLESGIAWK